MRNKFAPSEYNERIFQWFRSANNDGIVIARAGSGKTTSIFEGLIHLSKYEGQRSKPRKVLYVVFNKDMKAEANEKLLEYAADFSGMKFDIKTSHQVGCQALYVYFGTVNQKFKIDDKGLKAYKISKDVCHAMAPKQMQLRRRIWKAVNLAKNMGFDPRESNVEQWEKLGKWNNLFDSSNQIELLISMFQVALLAHFRQTEFIDYNDMVWMPPLLQAWPLKYDVVIIDEGQDWNRGQRWLGRCSRKKDGRLLIVGDDRQAIYGFRGAFNSFKYFDRMLLGNEQMKLPRTYRCGEAIVEKVRPIVPDFEADINNRPAVVNDVNQLFGNDQPAPGDFVISRKNSHLIPAALQILREGIPAYVVGKDLKSKIEIVIDEVQTQTSGRTNNFEKTLNDLIQAKTNLVMSDKHLTDEQIDLAIDELQSVNDILIDFKKKYNSYDTMRIRLETLFTESNKKNAVACMTVHKSKGLETNKVWLLYSSFNRTFESGKSEEHNMLYVAATRAKTGLNIVYSNDESNSIN